MSASSLRVRAAAPTFADSDRGDASYVVGATLAIVLSGTPVASAVIVAFGVVGLVRLLAGRPIAAGWVLLLAPPLTYLAIGALNGQIGGLDDLMRAADADFRVVGLIPVMLFAATHRLQPREAGRTLSWMVTGVTFGLVVDLVVTTLAGAEESLLLSSHHAVGFAAAVTAVTAFTAAPGVIAHRGLIVVLAALTLFASGSRSGIAAGFAAFCAIPVLRMVGGLRPGWSVTRVLRFFAAVAAIGAAAMLVAPTPLQRVTDTAVDVVEGGLNTSTFGRPSESGAGVSEADRNVAVRLGVWDELVERANQGRWMRFEAGTVDDVLTDSVGEPSHSEFSAHNIFLQLAVELGWIGLVLYVAVSTAGVRLLMRGCAPSTRVTMAAIWIAVLAFGLTSNSLLSPAVMVPAVLFLQLLACDPERTRT